MPGSDFAHGHDQARDLQQAMEKEQEKVHQGEEGYSFFQVHKAYWEG